MLIIIHSKECMNRLPLRKRSIIQVRVTKKIELTQAYHGLHQISLRLHISMKTFSSNLICPVKGVWLQSSN